MSWLGVVTVLEAQAPVVKNLKHVNTDQSQISPVLYGDQLVYLHQPPNGKVDAKSGNIFYEMFAAEPNENSRKKPRPFATELKSTHHEGPLTFSQDLKQVFFTRTNIRQGVVQVNERGKVGLKIYYAFQGPYEWQGLRELNFNSDQFSCIHPTLSADGNRIFFASDRPGGFGGLDLYLSEWQNGDWGNPINLGPEVNTSKDEAFPFIHANGHLFFASEGQVGNGGWDIFMIDLSGRSWGKVYNLPPPFNSSSDDFGFILEPSLKSGFLASNRPGGLGRDDIYSFTAPRGLEEFTGNSSSKEVMTIYDAGNSRQLAGAEVWVTEVNRPNQDESPPELFSTPDGQLQLRPSKASATKPTKGKIIRTDQEGKADLLLKEGQSYRVLIHKTGFAPGEIRFDYGPAGASRPLEAVLQPASCIMVTGDLVDQSTGVGIGGVKISFFPTDCPGSTISAVTEQDGSYYVCVPKGCNYQIVCKHPRYEEKTSALGTVRPRMENLKANLVLTPLGGLQEASMLRPDAVIVLEELGYENEQYELKHASTKELALLLNLLRANPKLTILISNHTETNGPPPYFEDISKKRVESIKDYLLARGISQDRIQTVSHGAKVPRNNCGSNPGCKPEEHLKNRRTEVRILSMGVR